MAQKKLERKKVSRARVSLVSSSLAGALRGTVQAVPAAEPWRKPQGKGNPGKRQNNR